MAQELKAFDVGLGRYSEDGSPCIVAFDADQNPRVLDGQIYLKDEVDAVLSEKDAEIRRLQRALWVTRTAWAKSEKDRWDAHVDCGNKRNRKDPAFVKTGKLLEVSEWRKLWADNEFKCRAKAEEFK